MWDTLAIDSDGSVTVCCYDGSQDLQIGNIYVDSPRALFEGLEINSIRFAHSRGDLSQVKRCRGCVNDAYGAFEISRDEFTSPSFNGVGGSKERGEEGKRGTNFRAIHSRFFSRLCRRHAEVSDPVASFDPFSAVQMDYRTVGHSAEPVWFETQTRPVAPQDVSRLAPIRIVNIKIFDEHWRRNHHIEPGGALKIAVETRGSGDLLFPVVGLALVDESGAVACYDNLDAHRQIPPDSGGFKRFTFEWESVPVREGRYEIVALVASRTDSKIAARCVSPVPLVVGAKRRELFEPPDSIHLNSPLKNVKPLRIEHLDVNVSGLCNLDCVMCPWARGDHSKAPAYLDIHRFVDWLRRGEQEGVTFGQVALSWKGEALMHPQFVELVEILCGRNGERQAPANIEAFALITNGLLLDEKLTGLMLSARAEGTFPFELITFSVDAVKPETYSAIRRGGDLDKVLENVRRFMQRRSELELTEPRIVVQIIAQQDNADEVETFIDFWKLEFKRYGVTPQVRFDYEFSRDTIFVKRLDSPDPAAFELFEGIRRRLEQ